MKTVIRSNKSKGRGVYADENMGPKKVIEVCQMILFELKDVKGKLEGYIYEYDKNTVGIALGNGSLFNHSDSPNADFKINRRKKTLTIIAKKQIKKGDEITINYGYTAEDKKRFGLK